MSRRLSNYLAVAEVEGADASVLAEMKRTMAAIVGTDEATDRLIAAAADLHEALDAIADHVAVSDEKLPAKIVRKMVRALAKARGQS